VGILHLLYQLNVAQGFKNAVLRFLELIEDVEAFSYFLSRHLQILSTEPWMLKDCRIQIPMGAEALLKNPLRFSAEPLYAGRLAHCSASGSCVRCWMARRQGALLMPDEHDRHRKTDQAGGITSFCWTKPCVLRSLHAGLELDFQTRRSSKDSF
jgi:hypothetical protein